MIVLLSKADSEGSSAMYVLQEDIFVTLGHGDHYNSILPVLTGKETGLYPENPQPGCCVLVHLAKLGHTFILRKWPSISSS
jgi:hypothetical protein